MPLVLLASVGANSPIAMQAFQGLQNVLGLDRPVHLPTLVSAVRTALRSRQRQYEIRDHLDERERAEKSLARLAAIVESSDDAILSKDLTGTIRSWSQGAQRIFGYSAEEMLGRSITLLIPPERRGEEEEILRRLRRGERVDHFETVRLTKDGRHIHGSVTISPIRDSAGQVVGASKIVRDITERRRAEDLLRKSEEKFRTIVDTTSEWIWEIDREGHHTYSNPAIASILGSRPEEIVSADAFDLIHPEDKKRMREQLLSSIKERKGWHDLNVEEEQEGAVPRLDPLPERGRRARQALFVAPLHSERLP